MRLSGKLRERRQLVNTPLVHIWTEKKPADTSDQAVQNAIGEIAQVGIDGGLDNDATNLDGPTNEAGATGGVVTGERLKRFLQSVDRRMAVEIPLSGVAMEFDGCDRRVK
jgi:hypothetical protein